MVPYILSGKTITMFLKGKSWSVTPDHRNYKTIRGMLSDPDGETEEDFLDLVDVALAIKKFTNGTLVVDSVTGAITYEKEDGEIINLHNSLVERILQMEQNQEHCNHLIKFLENLLENPDEGSIDELYGFMEKNNLPITDDGHFLAYKVVSNEYLDLYSRSISNAVGKVVSMPREEVDPDRDRTCSRGLHFCSYDYIPFFGQAIHGNDRVVVLKINPRDVVSIPSDYEGAKGRCCLYEVVAELDDAETRRIRPYHVPDENMFVDHDESESDFWNEDDLYDDDDDFEEESSIDEFLEELDESEFEDCFEFIDAVLAYQESKGLEILSRVSYETNSLGRSIPKKGYSFGKIPAGNHYYVVEESGETGFEEINLITDWMIENHEKIRLAGIGKINEFSSQDRALVLETHVGEVNPPNVKLKTPVYSTVKSILRV